MQLHEKINIKRRLLALLLTALCLLGACPAFALAEGEESAAEKPCSIEVVSTTNEELKAELDQIEIRVDVYQIAAIKTDNGAYTYTLVEPFTGLTLNPVTSGTDEESKAASEKAAFEMWAEFAQKSAETVRDASEKPTPVLTLSAGKEIEGLSNSGAVDQGLFLLIAHTDAEEYWDTVKTKTADEEAPTETETIVSLAHSADKDYLFTPVLVSLPYKAEQTDATKAYSTDDENPWFSSVRVVLKPEPRERLGKIKIVKTLSGYVGPDPAQFVFEITGEGPDGKELDSRIVSLQFTGNGSKETVELEYPIGSKLTVTEVYKGSRYTTGADVVEGLVVKADEVAQASFTNTHDGTNTGGYGIVNNYKIVTDSSGKLIWSEPEQLKENAAADEQTAQP